LKEDEYNEGMELLKMLAVMSLIVWLPSLLGLFGMVLGRLLKSDVLQSAGGLLCFLAGLLLILLIPAALVFTAYFIVYGRLF